MKKIIGCQGEITIIELDAAPAGFANMPKAERHGKGWIISHSESGHHHLLTGGDVREQVKDVPAGMRVLYAILENPEALIQDAQTPHGQYDLGAKFYCFKMAREYDPFAEQARRVAD